MASQTKVSNNMKKITTRAQDQRARNHVLSPSSSSFTSSLPLPCRREEYGVGGIGKTVAAGVLYRRLGKGEDLLKDLEVDDKFSARGLDPKEGYEELSKNLVHRAGRHPWSLKRLGSSLNNESKDQWRETMERLANNPYLQHIFAVYMMSM